MASANVSAAVQQFQVYQNKLDKELSKVPALVTIEKVTNVPKTYLVSAVGGVLAVLIFFNVWGSLLTNLLGFLYPAYASFKALESANKEDDVQWLTYWTVYGFINMIEFFSDILLYWLPLYYTMKAVFILWLALPLFRGAEVLYKQVFRPILIAQSSKIDNVSDKIKNKINETASEISNEFKKD
ncbi:TB2/DP1, HVA22 family-domain-containing protein [Entophlyctis helioformis]|nr:TB2/DP1, HVA22 family-domain-containing protein [Entophlyctis helioformis]